MSKAFNWLNFVYAVYLGLVCLISGIILCVNTGSLVKNVIEYNIPQLRAETYYNAYSEWDITNSPEEKRPKLTEEEREERKKAVLKRAEWTALRGVVNSLVYWVISGLVFGFHWRLFKRSRVDS